MQYDNFSQTFAKSRDNMHWDIIDQILHLSQISDQSHILDIGCGSGRLYQYLRTTHCRYTGFDSSQGMIDQALSRYPDGCFYVGDMTKESSYKEKYTHSISLAALHHIESVVELRQTLSIIRQHLLPGGKFFATYWNLFDGPDAQKYSRDILNPSLACVPIGSYMRKYFVHTQESLLEAYTDAGFSDISFQKDLKGRNYLVSIM